MELQRVEERRRAIVRPPAIIVSLERLRAAHLKVAMLVAEDSAFQPIFERLERDLKIAEALDPIARARAVVSQKAML